MQSRGGARRFALDDFGTGLSSFCLCCASSEAVPTRSRPSTRRSLFQVSVSGFRKPSNATPQNGGVIRVRSFPFPYCPSSLLNIANLIGLGSGRWQGRAALNERFGRQAFRAVRAIPMFLTSARRSRAQIGFHLSALPPSRQSCDPVSYVVAEHLLMVQTTAAKS